MSFKKQYLGLSKDWRTNKWSLTCDCGYKWEPTTTMMGRREERCPICQKTQVVDYNLPDQKTE